MYADVGWVDSHCHLHDTRGARLADVIAAARAAGVDTMVTVGCDAASTARSIEIAAAHDGVWATAGLHPHEARHGVETISGYLGDPHVVAVGECGLDYYYDHSPRDTQRAAFAAQIALAHEHRLPLVVHSRDAWPDTFDVLDAEGVPEQTVFHCFTGGPAELDECLDRGAFVSFSGIVTFRGALDVQEAARRCPLDRMLVETDSPYLAPAPHRGRPNQPAWVADVGRFVAELRQLPTERVRSATRDAALLAFPRLRS